MNDAWAWRPLGEMTIAPSMWNPRTDPRPSIRYVDVSAVSRDELGIVSYAEHSAVDAPSRARKVVKTGDTIFATVRPSLRRIARVPASLDGEIVSTAFCVLRPSPSAILPDFLYFAMQLEDVTDGIAAMQTGASYPAVRDIDVLSQTIPLPPLSDQYHIATALDLVRSAVCGQKKSENVARTLKRAAMQTLFTRGLRGEAQKETEIGPVPESWNVVGFSSVRHKLQYGTSVRCTYELSDRPVLRIPNIEPQRVNTNDLKYCALTGYDAAKYQLEDGDLIFIRTNGVLNRLGSCAVYNGYPANALFASYLIRAKVKPDYVVPQFAASFFGSEIGTHIVSARANAASDGKFNLNTAAIDSLLIPLPPTLREQREIVSILDAIDRKIDLHQRKRAVLDELFKALLHKLMTGEIQVGELDLAGLVNASSKSPPATQDTVIGSEAQT